MKNLLIIVCGIVFLMPLSGLSQHIRLKDQYGEKVYFDGNTVREKDMYGENLLFDDQTIRRKDMYGYVLYYIDGKTVI